MRSVRLIIQAAAASESRVIVGLVGDEVRIVKPASSGEKFNVWEPPATELIGDTGAAEEVLL